MIVSLSTINGQKDIDVLRKSLRQVNDRVVSLQKLMIDSHIMLEKLCTTIHQEDQPSPDSQKFAHILSRESPYVYTTQARFPVTEKSIPWTVSFNILHQFCCFDLDTNFRFYSIFMIPHSSHCRKSTGAFESSSDYWWNLICENEIGLFCVLDSLFFHFLG